jgi:mono/diheme cytochrome c family protein
MWSNTARNRVLFGVAMSVLGTALGRPGGAVSQTDGKTSRFEREVLPILAAHCVKCHGQGTPQADLDLRTEASLLKGSKNGLVVVKGSAEQSHLFQRVVERTMPPRGENPLGDDQIAAIRKWIDAAATTEQPLSEGVCRC